MQKNTRTNAMVFFLLFHLVIWPAVAEEVSFRPVEPSHLLDGRNFYGQNGSFGKAADHDDELIFKNGNFRSTSCDTYGFKNQGYSATRDGDKIHFQAVTLSKDHGKIVWVGTVANDKIEASFVWTKERWYWNTRKEYWFEGAER